MKKKYLFYILIFFILYEISDAQVHNGYVVKSLNNIIIIDRGEYDGIFLGLRFKVYHHKKGRGHTKTKDDLENYGIAEVIQTFNDLSVLKFSTLEKGLTPKQGSYVTLIDPALFINSKIPAESKNYQKLKILKTENIKTKSIAKDVFNHSVSMGLVGGYENFPNAVLNKIEEFLINDIYPYGINLEKSTPLRGGMVFTMGKRINRFSSVRLNYGNLSYNRYLSSAIPDNVYSEVNLPEQYVKNWHFKIKTTIYTLSSDIILGNFKFALNPFKEASNIKNFNWYTGLGLDYASFNYLTIETMTLHRYNRDDVVNDSIEHTREGYWGIHGLTGLTYNFSTIGIYAEGGFTLWSKKILKKSYPFRLGLSFHF